MKRIYIAGPYSADNVIKVLENMRNGMRLSTEVMLSGYAPFCPWLDYHFALMCREGERIAVEDYYQYSLAWLEASDAILVLPVYKNSKGTLAEITRAQSLGIPVYYSIEELWEKMPPE